MPFAALLSILFLFPVGIAGQVEPLTKKELGPKFYLIAKFSGFHQVSRFSSCSFYNMSLGLDQNTWLMISWHGRAARSVFEPPSDHQYLVEGGDISSSNWGFRIKAKNVTTRPLKKKSEEFSFGVEGEVIRGK